MTGTKFIVWSLMTKMKYENIVTGIFLERPNRFIAMAEVDGKTEKCHVKNTGRCKEILVPGAELYLQDHWIDGKADSKRKTRYDVIAVKKGNQIVNMDSQVPNKAVAQWLAEGNLFSRNAVIRPEQKYGNSRFDLYIEDGDRRAFMEIKGVTLEADGIARFPDAPTQRGVKHVQELCQCRKDGYEAYIFFLIQMKGVHRLEPNWRTHEAFGKALMEAQDCGVQILACDSVVTEDSIVVGDPVEVSLEMA